MLLYFLKQQIKQKSSAQNTKTIVRILTNLNDRHSANIAHNSTITDSNSEPFFRMQLSEFILIPLSFILSLNTNQNMRIIKIVSLANLLSSYSNLLHTTIEYVLFCTYCLAF